MQLWDAVRCSSLHLKMGGGARICFIPFRAMVMAPIRRVDSPSINPSGKLYGVTTQTMQNCDADISAAESSMMFTRNQGLGRIAQLKTTLFRSAGKAAVPFGYANMCPRDPI